MHPSRSILMQANYLRNRSRNHVGNHGNSGNTKLHGVYFKRIFLLKIDH
jgi:hypothetical protein